MTAMFVASLLLASSVKANVVPREALLRTLEIPLPTQVQPFTSTVPGCGNTVEPFVVVGVPTGTFRPGTFTVYLPPQASPTSTTIIDSLNATEVIFVTPLQGECEAFPLPTPTPSSASGSPSATATAAACPENSCGGKIIKTAKTVIDVINKVTLLSQNLQTPAKLIGAPLSKREPGALQTPFDDIVKGLRDISITVTTAIPRLSFIPPFPPGCDTDAIVIALIQFVRVHQELLNILIGRSGLLTEGPIRKNRGVVYEGSQMSKRVPNQAFKDDQSALIGAAVAEVLRAVEGAVDTLAFTILKLIPTRGACAQEQKDSIDQTLDEAIDAYKS